jgi:hypothetical protein
MRLPGMTTRRWMVAVAVVALLAGGLVGGYRLKRRRDYFLSRIYYHNLMASLCRDFAHPLHSSDSKDFIGTLLQDVPPELPSVEELTAGMVRIMRESHGDLSELGDFHKAMACKYRHAARYPWLPVEPDPPGLNP